MEGCCCYAPKSIEKGLAFNVFGVTMLLTGRSLTSAYPLATLGDR